MQVAPSPFEHCGDTDLSHIAVVRLRHSTASRRLRLRASGHALRRRRLIIDCRRSVTLRLGHQVQVDVVVDRLGARRCLQRRQRLDDLAARRFGGLRALRRDVHHL